MKFKSTEEMADFIKGIAEGSEEVFEQEAYECLLEIAEHLRKAAPPEEQRWVSVKDRLPENTSTMLVYDCYAGRCLGYYVKDISGWIKALDGDRLYEITHWMPLPPNPQSPPQNSE